jgi:hypothetical protein
MIADTAREYIEAETAKLGAHSTASLADVFARFTSAYNIFSRIAGEISDELFLSEKIKKLGEDGNAATKNILLYADAADMNKHLTDRGNERDILEVAAMIARQQFNIVFDRFNVHQRATDEQLAADLQRSNIPAKMLALLQTLYFIRCNNAHTRKHFEEEQRRCWFL